MKPLKLTRKSDGMPQYINPLAVSYFHWDDDRNYTEVWILGEAPSNGPVPVTETPDAIAAMLADDMGDTLRAAQQAMDFMASRFATAMDAIETAGYAVRNAQ